LYAYTKNRYAYSEKLNAYTENPYA